MSFVVTSGNKQYLVQNGQLLIVDRIESDINSTVELPVLHTAGEGKSPKTIKATVVSHQKGEKIRVVKYKAKSNYHRQYGYRAAETVLKIEGDFVVADSKPAKPASAGKKTNSKPSTSKSSTSATTKKTTTKATKKPASASTKAATKTSSKSTTSAKAKK